MFGLLGELPQDFGLIERRFLRPITFSVLYPLFGNQFGQDCLTFGDIWTIETTDRYALSVFCLLCSGFWSWRRTQVVREGSAKPRFSGSNPLVASTFLNSLYFFKSANPDYSWIISQSPILPYGYVFLLFSRSTYCKYASLKKSRDALPYNKLDDCPTLFMNNVG